MGIEFKGTAGRKTQMVILPLFNFCAKEILTEEQIDKLDIIMDISKVAGYADDESDVSILYPDDEENAYRLFVLANLNKKNKSESSKDTIFVLASLMALHIYLIKFHLEGDLVYDNDRELWKGQDVTDLDVEDLEYLKIASSGSEEAVDNFMKFANDAVSNLFS
jgi:hypothetical protein